MTEKIFRKKIVDFIIEQNKKSSPRANKIKVSEKKEPIYENGLISKKANNVRKILNSGTFGCNTDKVHTLMEVVLDENFPINYNYENSHKKFENDSIFENYDRKKKFVNFSLLECSDLNDNENFEDDFYLKVEDRFYYNCYDDNWIEHSTEDNKYFETATETQVREFVKGEDYENLKTFFAFLNLE